MVTTGAQQRTRWIAAGVLAALLVALLVAGLVVGLVPSAGGPGTQPGPPGSLKAAAGDRIRIGTAVAMPPALSDATYAEALRQNFDSVTPENQMKWSIMRPERTTWNFGPADELVAFARANGQTVRGHTLLWHGANPSWVTDSSMDCAEMRDVVREHIVTVVGRYRGAVSQWDVVNEVLDANGKPRSENPFVTACGMGIVADAFRWAHEADPDALLFLNDYSAESINTRSNAYYDLVQQLLAQGVPIHGIGFQSHLRLESGVPDSMPENLERFAALGLQIAITEADVRLDLSPWGAVPEERAAGQAAVYDRLLEVCLDQPACRSFTLWGYTDRYSWLPEGLPGQGWATIMTDQYVAKPAYDALRQRLESKR